VLISVIFFGIVCLSFFVVVLIATLLLSTTCHLVLSACSVNSQ
jgi:hypothetical protein